MEAFVDAIKQTSQIEYLSEGEVLAKDEYSLDESGEFDLDGQKAIHFSIPSGVFKGSDLKRAGELSKSVDGSIRLSVEQSLYIITEKVDEVKSSELFKEYSKYHNTYFNHQIACAGTATCAFGVIPNKPDAIKMAEYLQQEVPIVGAKVRMYWSACPKGCGIHGVADIGFEGCIVKDENGEKQDGVHIFIGGKATSKVAEAKVYAKAVPLTKAKYIVKELMEKYRDERLESESFESFESRVGFN
jgi:ferredoxin-nitrite reductase